MSGLNVLESTFLKARFVFLGTSLWNSTWSQCVRNVTRSFLWSWRRDSRSLQRPWAASRSPRHLWCFKNERRPNKIWTAFHLGLVFTCVLLYCSMMESGQQIFFDLIPTDCSCFLTQCNQNQILFILFIDIYVLACLWR